MSKAKTSFLTLNLSSLGNNPDAAIDRRGLDDNFQAIDLAIANLSQNTEIGRAHV